MKNTPVSLNEVRSDHQIFEVLKATRVKFAFHFDRKELKKGIDALPHDPFVILHAYKRTQAEAYYELADIASLANLIDLHEYEDAGHRFRRVIGETTDYLLRFLTIAEQIIGQALKSHGVEITENGDD
jgi:hypothetical protein